MPSTGSIRSAQLANVLVDNEIANSVVSTGGW